MLLEEKLALMKDVFAATQQELLLIDLDGLEPLLERKDRLIAKIGAIDERLLGAGREGMENAPQFREIAETVEAILENERALEARMREEHARLHEELKELDRQSRLKQYLERQKRTGSAIDLKK